MHGKCTRRMLQLLSYFSVLYVHPGLPYLATFLKLFNHHSTKICFLKSGGLPAGLSVKFFHRIVIYIYKFSIATADVLNFFITDSWSFWTSHNIFTSCLLWVDDSEDMTIWRDRNLHLILTIIITNAVVVILITNYCYRLLSFIILLFCSLHLSITYRRDQLL